MFHRVLITLLSIMAASVLADPPQKPSLTTQKAEPKASRKDPAPFASAELAVLDRFAGPWNVRETHFNARGDTIGSAKGTEETTWILDRKVLKRTYTTGEEASLFRAIGMIVWNPVAKRYEGSWFDNTAAGGPTSLTGVWDEGSKTMTFTLSVTAPDGKPQQFKVIDRFLDEEHHVATTFKLEGSQVEKIMEVQFKRTVPCPAAGIGIIDPELRKDND